MNIIKTKLCTKQDSELSAMPVQIYREPGDEFPMYIGIELYFENAQCTAPAGLWGWIT